MSNNKPQPTTIRYSLEPIESKTKKKIHKSDPGEEYFLNNLEELERQRMELKKLSEQIQQGFADVNDVRELRRDIDKLLSDIKLTPLSYRIKNIRRIWILMRQKKTCERRIKQFTARPNMYLKRIDKENQKIDHLTQEVYAQAEFFGYEKKELLEKLKSRQSNR